MSRGALGREPRGSELAGTGAVTLRIAEQQ